MARRTLHALKDAFLRSDLVDPGPTVRRLVPSQPTCMEGRKSDRYRRCMNRRVWALAVIAGLLVAGFIVSIVWLSPEQAQKAAAIVQGLTSIALLAVTAAYVLLTRQLVDATANPRLAIRIEAEERTAVELLAIVTQMSNSVAALKSRFPLDPRSTEPPTPMNGAAYDHWTSLLQALESRWAQAPPSLMQLCAVSHATLVRASFEISCFYLALSMESYTAADEGRAWSYDRARQRFEDDCWSREIANRPDFDKLAAGSAIDKAKRASTDLYVALQHHVASSGRGRLT